MRWKNLAVTFLAVAVTGLVAWVLTNPLTTGGVFGERAGNISSEVVLYLGELLYYVPLKLPLWLAITAVAGYLSPRGFWLWGAAVVLLPFIAEIPSTNYSIEQGMIQSSAFWPMMIVLFVEAVLFAMACTVTAAIGAGLRVLWCKLARRGEADTEGEPSEGAARINYGAVAVGAGAAFAVDTLLLCTLIGSVLGFNYISPLDLSWLSSATGAVIIVVLDAVLNFVVPFLGGYVAGHRAGLRGGAHGLAVVAGFLLLKLFSMPVLEALARFVPTVEGIEVDQGLGYSDFAPALAFAFVVAVLVTTLLVPLAGGYLGGTTGTARHPATQTTLTGP